MVRLFFFFLVHMLFFGSEFLFRGAYNVSQRQSRSRISTLRVTLRYVGYLRICDDLNSDLASHNAEAVEQSGIPVGFYLIPAPR